jgi:hypothetical protein
LVATYVLFAAVPRVALRAREAGTRLHQPHGQRSERDRGDLGLGQKVDDLRRPDPKIAPA